MQSSSLSIRLYNLLQEKKVFLVFIPLGIYWAIILIATSIPTDPLPKLFRAQDKLEHFAAYFILAILLSLAIHFQKKFHILYLRPIFFAFIFLACYAAIDELHQYFIPGRYCDFLDWTADVIGGVIGLFIVKILIKRNSG